MTPRRGTVLLLRFALAASILLGGAPPQLVAPSAPSSLAVDSAIPPPPVVDWQESQEAAAPPLALECSTEAHAAAQFAANAAFTITKTPAPRGHSECLWLRYAAVTTDQVVVYHRDGNVTGNTEVLETPAANGALDLDTATKSTTTQTITANNWYFYCWTINGTGTNNVNVYWTGANGGALSTKAATDASVPAAFNTNKLGADISGTNYTGRAACVKAWDTVLAQLDFELEEYHCRYQHAASIDYWFPMWNASDATIDYSGQGNNATAGTSAVTTADGPPAAL